MDGPLGGFKCPGSLHYFPVRSDLRAGAFSASLSHHSACPEFSPGTVVQGGICYDRDRKR